MHGTLAQELENLAPPLMGWQPIMPFWTSFPSLYSWDGGDSDMKASV